MEYLNPFRLFGAAVDQDAVINSPIDDDAADNAAEQQLQREAEAAQQNRPPPGIPMDTHLWTQYLARLQPTILPTDPAFQTQLTHFHTVLAQLPIETVLRDNFCEFDVWRFIQGRLVSSSSSSPGEQKQNAFVRATQDRDTAAYKHLMTNHPAWRDARGRESLAFKVTMMWFGVPVQPMLFRDSLMTMNDREGRSTLFDDEDDELLDGDDGDDGEMTYFVPEAMRPLRFLNHYPRIMHGKDNGHSKF